MRHAMIAMLLAALLAPVPALARADPVVLAATTACARDARILLPRLVAIDSGTGDGDGLKAVTAIYADELGKTGAAVRLVAPRAPGIGDNIVATLTGTGTGRILLIAHIDTVFARGDAAKRPPRWDGDTLFGPGAGDDKSGGVTALCALRAVQAAHYRDFGRIDLLLNASEETGSYGSRDLIRTLAKASDLVVNLERGIPGDKVLVARKGSATLTFDVTGRAAHSGLEPEKGRNAALEAARVALAIGSLADPAKETSATVDIIHSGERTNVVPDRAVVKADIRAYTTAEFDRVEAAAAAIAAHPGIDGVTIRATLDRGFPPWPHVASTDVIVARANRLYREIGRRLTPTQVGSSADVALAAETGTPSIDGFGMEGGGAHSLDDHADFVSLPPRAYLLARLLMDVGHDPVFR